MLAATLPCLAIASPEEGGPKPLDRFYGTLGGSLSTFSNNEFGDQSTSWRSVHASIGRQFTPKTNLSIDVRFSDSETSTTYPGLPYSITYGYRSLSFSLNSHRTLYQRGRFSLSAGGGIGIDNGKQRQSYRLDDGQTFFETTESHTRFQYNLGSNVNWSFTNRLTVSMGYRRSWTVLEEGTWNNSMIDFTLRASVKPQRF
ncbi:MAG: outer membrane beta-barrel protein [Gammaproteobacteria bacterium]|nr:outer membrane beta-barrel protein [Gammaproteobacteria bacterium]MDE0270036.1 outer membrane beta-barrel protein [Gammaproteobacteria bacterium]